jgi:hypothetical protein
LKKVIDTRSLTLTVRVTGTQLKTTRMVQFNAAERKETHAESGTTTTTTESIDKEQ